MNIRMQNVNNNNNLIKLKEENNSNNNKENKIATGFEIKKLAFLAGNLYMNKDAFAICHPYAMLTCVHMFLYYM